MIIKAFKKTFSDRFTLDFPGMELERGKIYALIGANGSGKSTFAKVLSGIETADGRKPVCEAASVGYMPQKSYGFSMSTLKNVMLNGKSEDEAMRLLDEFGIKNLAKSNGSRLSGGETAKMALCRLMMNTYDIIVLDEPCASMDIESCVVAENEIKKYCSEKNCAVIIITHSIQQARRISDEILFFHRGKLLPLDDEKGKQFLSFA